MNFEFATATRILFGPGTLAQAAPVAAALGRHVLLVQGGPADLADSLRSDLVARGVAITSFVISGEPTVEKVIAGAAEARRAGCDLVIGLGGGSAMDAAKAIAALSTNAGDPLDYLEVVGRGRPLSHPPLPIIAIPTTAGTGAEVTRNAVLASPEHRVKVSLRSPLMLPRLAIVDPELTYSLPPDITASTGLDALTQVMEPFVSHKANPLTNALCREGLIKAGRSLRRVYENGRDAASREEMALVSLLGGLALANAALGAVHGFAGPLGGMYPAPHGLICARILPHVMETNVRAMQERAPQHPALTRYDEVARLLTGRPEAKATDGVAWVQSLCRDLAIPPLCDYGLAEEAFPEVVAKAQAASSMKGNPIPLTDQELTQILHLAV